MNLKKIIKNNLKLYIILGVIILLGTIGVTLAFVSETFNPIAINTTTSTIDADITYDSGTNTSVVTNTNNLLPIEDSLVTLDTEDPRVLKVHFNVTGVSSNPEETIYDVALYEIENGIDCELRTEDVKWRLYKNGEEISNGNLSPTFDVMDNGRLVLTNTQQDLTLTPDKYTFILWISESCTGDITTCNPTQAQNKYLNKNLNGALKIELATKSKKTLVRTKGEELSCEYTSVDIPACNSLTYNKNEQTFINSNALYTVKNNTGALAGSYKVLLKLQDGYKWSDETTGEKTINCDIAKKNVTVSTTSQTISYGSNISTDINNLEVTGLLEGHTLKSALITPSNASIGKNIINVSNAVIIDSENKDVTNNYQISYNSTGTLQVNCLNNAKLPTKKDYTYTGESFTGITGGTNVEITGISTATEIGTYTVTITPKENYCWTDSTTTPKTLTWKILDNAVTITLDNLVTTTNGTGTLYYKDNKYYTSSTYNKAMTTTSVPISLPIKVGYTFDGYYTEKNGAGTLMIDKNGYATEDLLNTDQKTSRRLYANWIQKEYTITYDANGGIETYTPQFKSHGETITLSDITPTNGEEPFLGWSTDPNATSGIYMPGDTITVNANLNLYAIWPTYIDLTITKENRDLVWTPDENNYIKMPGYIPRDDGTWYKVVAIDDEAFFDMWTSMDISIEFPNTLEYIGRQAFYWTNLGTVIIPESVKEIASEAFYDSGLNNVIINGNNLKIGNSAFNLNGLSNISITGENITIGNSAFSLEYLPNSININISGNNILIEKKAFYLDHLNENEEATINISGNNITIGESSFAGNDETNIDEPVILTIAGENISIGQSAFTYLENLTITSLEGVTSIGDSAFEHSGVESVPLPSTLKTIGAEAFYFCNLQQLTIPDSVTSIGRDSFAWNFNLDSPTLSKNLTEIPAGAFSGANGTIEIPEGVTHIGNSAFSFGSIDIILPDSLLTIGEGVFVDTYIISGQLILPNNLVSIGYQAFWSTVVDSIVIPKSVVSIGEGAFEYTFSTNNEEEKTEIYYTGTEEEWNAITIGEKNYQLTNIQFNYVAS